MARVIYLIWSLLVLDGVHGGNTDHGFYGNNFGVRESPLSLFEMQGARQVNKFTRGGLYRTTFNEYSVVSSYVISPLKMGIYIADDTAVNGVLEYAVSAIGQQTRRIGVNCSGTNLFDVQGELYGNFFALKIKTKRLLTEGRCESYLLSVEAKIDKRTVDTTQVFIQTRMSANFEPRFNKTRISETIPNNFPLFQQITQLKTKNVKDWGKVYFSLQQESKYFILNPVNGILFLKQSLPLGINRFDLVAAVTKWDSKPNLQTFTDNTCKITIKVRNVNQYAPTIDVTVLDKRLSKGNKQAIAIITVSDLDQGKNGKIDELKLLSGNENGNFGLERVDPDGAVFKLYLVKSLDCHHCWFRFTFEATDRGNPPMSTTNVHRFSLKDPLLKNDSFIADEYFVEISEMMPIDYTIIDLKPQTLGTMSNISCTIVEGVTLIVPKNTCKIKLGVPLDAKVRSSYVLKVSYKISGDTTASGSTIVHVNVVDFNNHGPVFVSKSHYVKISEDMALHANVYEVKVKDDDVGDNGKLTYWLMNDSSQFKIDPNTGMISVKQVSDRDTGTPEFAYLVVRVADNGSPFRREAEAVVTVRIKARNDNVPVIKQDTCQIKLSPDTSVGTKLVQIEAVDIDVDSNSKISYSLISGNTDSMFAIDSNSGYVTLANPLSSIHTSFSLLVSAHDGTRRSQNNAVLQITIEDQQTAKDASCTVSNMYVRALKSKQIKVAKNPDKPVVTSKTPRNTYAPNFTDKVLTITVSEDVKVGTVLATLKAVDNDNGYEGLLTYYIVDGKQNHCFGIDALTGELRLIAGLNWEHVAKHELNVSAWDSGVPRKVGFVKVAIVVENENDNPPKFSQDFYNVSVSENLPPGTTIVKLISRDTMVSKRFTFNLVNDYNKIFSVDSGSGGLNLITSKRLDFEEQKLYEIQVLALDGSFGNQPTPRADIIVNVEDFNDNYPVVYHSNPHVIIMRDLPVGSPITQITAGDADSGIDGVVNFAMIKSFGSELFSIDSNNGLMKLSSSLTGKTQESYNLSITVSDGGEPSLTTNTYVNILVIQRTGGQSLKVMSSHSGISQYVVHENRPAGEKIAELGGSDIPVSKRDKYLFSIIDGTDVTMFNVSGTPGWLKTTGSLDREEVPYYWLTIQVVNKQSKQFHSIIHILIKVEDENDNGPIFYPPVYESSIPENTKPGEFVIALTANDADSGENGNLSYAIIQGNDKGHFDIDAATGIITTTNIQLDFESQRMLRLLVSVTDGGKQRKTNQATVTIYVQDENDNHPKFHPDLTVQYSMSGRNNLPTNTLLGQVLAHDKDNGKNGALTFRILSGNTGGKLRINAKSGQLYNNVPISDLDAFQLEIEAKDSGQPALSSTTSVNVFSPISQTPGKNPPIFPKKVEEISLSESTPVGHKIDIKSAIDKDFDTLSYFIYTGNEEQKFRMNNFGNQLEVIAELEPPSYQLIIGTSDGLYSGNFTLNIKIKDINNHYPIPQMTEKIATIPENAYPGKKVTKVSASDLDFGDNSRLRYSFKSATQPKSLHLFSLNEDSGEIFLTGKLDYEDIKKHVLIVEIKDRSSKPKESMMYVVVNVEDVNEWKPVFVKPSYDVYIPENLPRGSDVVKVIAKDPDQGLNGILKYSITSGNHGYAFSIRPQSGVIQTNKVLSASDISEYVLTLEARDDGSYGLSATVNVTIRLHRNGYKSGFAKSSYSASVYENEPVNTYVTSVNFNGLMAVYTIIEDIECADRFQINPFTGVISTKEILDAEKTSFCSLRVKAQDGSGYTQEISLDVETKNKNDNSPVVEHAFFTGYIEENSPEDSQVLTSDGRPLVISARDSDIVNSQLKYKIINSAVTRYFKIGEQTGEICTTKVTLDYETRQSYRLLVKVSDQGSPSLSTITTVIIHLKNINDIKPKFSTNTIEVRVYLPVYKDVHITTLTASDRDNLGNLAFTISQQDTPLLDVDSPSGRMFIKDPSKAQKGWYNAGVQVSDGKWTSSAKLRVVFNPIIPTIFQFSEPFFQTHARENISEVQTVFTPFARGYNVWEILRFSLSNFEDIFSIQESTGVVKTKPEVVLDRELIASYRLIIMVQDERTPPRIARCLVTVVVDDVNDCKPTFPHPPIFFVVSKRAETGSTIATIAASDCDIGKNGEIRYGIKKDESSMFGIDPSSGALSVLGQLDGLTTPAEFTLTIEAKDSGENPLKSEAKVSVRIESGDACIFEKPSYTVELAENAMIDKVFKQLHARCPKGKPVFSIVSGDNYSQFECDVNSGELSLLSELDFEEIPSYVLSVRAQDSKTGASSLATLHVLVQDINDNPPVIEASPYFVKVKESSPVRTSLLRVYTSDKDSGENQRRSYQIVSDTSLIPGSFVISEDTGILRIEKKLDYETQKRCDIVVRVTDHGVPSLSAETVVTVLVRDVNDHAPVFQRSHYHATVMENGGPSHFITQVLAKDGDESDYSKLKYCIVPGFGTRYFVIAEKSGVVSLSEVPGITLGKVYTLKLSVFDGNHTSFTKLDVVVGQSNNHPPKFQKDVYQAHITENYPANSYVAMVTATDQDSGKFGEVVYAIDSPAVTKDFKIDPNTGIITTERSLDRELMSSITIPVRASDEGGETTICSVKVKILDENDNQPRFLMPSYTAVVSASNTSVGESVIRVTAVDPDDGDNGALTYSLVGQRSPYVFGIDASSGVISFLRKPMESVYDFYVRANDNGYLKLKSYTPVRVYIQNLLFKFKYPHYSFTFSETVQGAVSARFTLIDDQGIPVASNIDYSVEIGNNVRTNKDGTFTINSAGQLQVSQSLDYETVQSYDLTIKANRSTFSTYAIVHIDILDANDNKPEFESDLYTVNVPENAAKGRNIVQVRAHDKDSKENALVSYQLASESKSLSHIFTVGSKTGWLSVNGNLDRETVPSYLVKIDARDHGRDISLNSTTSVKIIVDDVNDSPPIFSQQIYKVSIREDLPVYSTVLALNTVDRDTKSDVIYYIVQGDLQNKFDIDQASRKIYLSAKLDREIFPRYLLNITAFDGAFIASALVEIEITDVNDNKPICQQSSLRLSVYEDLVVGSSIVTINASDIDADNNSKIIFRIHSHSDMFAINSNKGTVVLKQHALDREKKSSYHLLISASDGDSSCYTNLTIDILDVNDCPPQFTKTRYIKLIAVDAKENAFLLRVEATDKDLGTNRKIGYGFMNSSTADLFTIEKETGVILLKSRLLQRDEEKFVFNVIATDGGVPSLSSIANIEITVSTIENCPFVKDVYKNDISEHVKPPYEVDTASVTCSSKDFSIIYKIASQLDNIHKLFEIDENTGKITLKSTLDYETTRTHIFTVEALMVKQSGKTILISSASVKIKVIDYNDNQPAFSRRSYEASVNERSDNGTIVILLSATDNDTSSHIHFSIIKSIPNDHAFVVDALNGIVTVQGELDREQVNKYELLVRVQDDGNPPLSSDVKLVVNIKDLNDNPPVVEKEIKMLLRTDTPFGSIILQLKPTDEDGPRNSKPFKFGIISGGNSAFRLNSSSGALLVQKPLTHHNITYNMILQTIDSGSPALSAQTHVEITVVKPTVNPPDVQPITVYVNMLVNKFTGGIIGQIIVNNQAEDTILQFTLLKGNPAFSIGSEDGAIRMLSVLDPGSYPLQVQVTDGTYKVNTQVTVRVKEISPDVVNNSVTVRITGKTLGSFVSTSLSAMINTLAKIKSCSMEDVYLWSIQTALKNMLDIVFAVKKKGKEEFFSPNNLRETLEDQLQTFQRLSKVVVSSVGLFPCDKRSCPVGKECRNVVNMLNEWSSLTGDKTIFLSYKNVQTSKCVCPVGISDAECSVSTSSECLNNPCKPGFKCIDHPTGYQCVCPTGTDCRQTCYGNKCHINAMTFNGNSYVRYSLRDEKTKISSFSVFLRTTKPSGTIFSVKGSHDYFILEIVDGRIRARFDYGSGEGVGIIDQVKVNDGKWHDVEMKRKERNVRLTLDSGKYMTESVASGSMSFLNVHMNNIIIGGELPKRSIRSATTVSNGYFGCMESPRLNGNDLPLSGSNLAATALAKGLTNNCSIDICHPSFCQNDGVCRMKDEEPTCECKPEFKSNDCSKDINECKLFPCKNNGKCINTFGSFRCECNDSNFNGVLCETRVAAVTRTGQFGTREFIFIGATVFVLIIIAVIIVLVCRCCHKRRRKAKSARQDHERHELKIKETDDEMPPYPPPPPPRRGDVDDPPTRLGSRAPSWDYADLPEMGPNRLKKFSDSDDYLNDSGEYSGTNGVPQVPRRPRHIETGGIPDVPKKPKQYRCSRASSQSSVRSQSFEDVSEIGEEGLELIRQGTKDIELITKAADVVDGLLGTNCATPPSDDDTQSECSQLDTQEPFHTGHLETYDDNEVAYFIPDSDMRDSVSNIDHEDETSAMLEKLPTVTDSRGEILHKESQL